MDLPLLDISCKCNHVTLVFCAWLLSLCIMFPRFIHVVACIRTSFFSMLEYIPVFGYTTFYLFTQLMGICFHILVFWVMLVWIFLYKLMCGHIFSFLLGIYLKVELLDHMLTLYLSFWGTARNIFPSGCTILHSYHQCMRLPISPHPCQYALLADFLILVILTGVK